MTFFFPIDSLPLSLVFRLQVIPRPGFRFMNFVWLVRSDFHRIPPPIGAFRLNCRVESIETSCSDNLSRQTKGLPRFHMLTPLPSCRLTGNSKTFHTQIYFLLYDLYRYCGNIPSSLFRVSSLPSLPSIPTDEQSC
jgi:hypothetical protein